MRGKPGEKRADGVGHVIQEASFRTAEADFHLSYDRAELVELPQELGLQLELRLQGHRLLEQGSLLRGGGGYDGRERARAAAATARRPGAGPGRAGGGQRGLLAAGRLQRDPHR